MTDSPNEKKMVGEVFAGRFRIERLVGTGAMGEIYRAHQIDMDRAVALKIVHPELWDDREVTGRFERELKATTRIEHPNSVRVYEYGRTPEGQPFLVMELLDGSLLSDVIAEEAPLPVERIAQIGMQLAQALSAAHAAGIVHRDLKPENVMLLDQYGRKDFAKVLDFGLSRLKADPGVNVEKLTLEGVRVGTPLYMAPEYVASFSVDHRADLYALGVILFEMATGRPPYTGRSYEILEQQVHGPVPRPSSHVPDIPGWLDELIYCLLAKDPEARPQSAAEVVRPLERAWASLVSRPELNPNDIAVDMRSFTPRPATAAPEIPATRLWGRGVLLAVVLFAFVFCAVLCAGVGSVLLARSF